MRSLVQSWATAALLRCGATMAFRIYGRANYEADWSIIDVVATHRRNADSRWPLWRNHCITWTANVVAVGWDYAARVIAEQTEVKATCHQPAQVIGGRLRDVKRRSAAGGDQWVSCTELLAHECGHTAQARRHGLLYWPLVGPVTLFREGPHWWNHFENQASETGEFGGIIDGTIHPRLAIVSRNDPTNDT